MKEIPDIYPYMFQFILRVYVGGVHWVHSTGRISIYSKVEKCLEESSVVHSDQDPDQAFQVNPDPDPGF
jgi:hypothetical protein